MIAPLWMDLIQNNNPGAGVYFTLDSNRLVVEWRNITDYGSITGTPVGNFEVILWQNGTLVFQYKDLNETEIVSSTPTG